MPVYVLSIYFLEMQEYTPPIIPTKFWIKLSALYFIAWVSFSFCAFAIGLVLQRESFENKLEEFEKQTYNDLVKANQEQNSLYRENIEKIKELQNWFDEINKKLQIVSKKTPIVTDKDGVAITSFMANEPKDIELGYNVSTLYQTAIKKYPQWKWTWSHENFIRTIAVENTYFDTSVSTGADRGLCQLNYATHKHFFLNLEKVNDREKTDFYIDYCLAVWNDSFKKWKMPRRGHYTLDHTKTTKQIRIAEAKRNLFKFSSIENKSLDIVSDFNNNI